MLPTGGWGGYTASLAVHWRSFGHLSRESEAEMEMETKTESESESHTAWVEGSIEELPPGFKAQFITKTTGRVPRARLRL